MNLWGLPWDSIATGHGVGKALLALVVLCIVLAWGLYQRRAYDSSKVLRSETVRAVVRRVRQQTIDAVHTKYGISREETIYWTTFELPDGGRLELGIRGMSFESGQEVPLVVNYLANGEKVYSLEKGRHVLNPSPFNGIKVSTIDAY